MLVQALAVYYFLEVPINIAFRSSERLGPVYLYVQAGLDGLLFVDMLVHCQRGFHNENSVLILDP